MGDYRERGYLPEAVCNYLLRLCWAHGDDEIIPQDKAIEWFDLGGVGSLRRGLICASDSVNAHYIRQGTMRELAKLVAPFLSAALGQEVTQAQIGFLAKGYA